MLHPARRGWLTFTAAVILSAGFLSVAPTTSHAQVTGTINSTGVQTGAGMPSNNDLLNAYQQVVALGQESQVNPAVLPAYDNAVQNFQSLLAQAQQQPHHHHSSQGGSGFGAGLTGFGQAMQPSSGFVGQTTGGQTAGGQTANGQTFSGSPMDFSQIGRQSGMSQNGWGDNRDHERHERERRERERRDRNEDHQDGDRSKHGDKTTATGDRSTTNSTASGKTSSQVGSRANGNSTAKASVKIVDQNGEITVKAFAQGGNSKASAQAVFNTNNSTSTASAKASTGHIGKGLGKVTSAGGQVGSNLNQGTTTKGVAKKTSGTNTSSTSSTSGTPTTRTPPKVEKTSTASQNTSTTSQTAQTTGTKHSSSSTPTTTHTTATPHTSTTTAHASAKVNTNTGTAHATARVTTNTASVARKTPMPAGGMYVGHQISHQQVAVSHPATTGGRTGKR